MQAGRGGVWAAARQEVWLTMETTPPNPGAGHPRPPVVVRGALPHPLVLWPRVTALIAGFLIVLFGGLTGFEWFKTQRLLEPAAWIAGGAAVVGLLSLMAWGLAWWALRRRRWTLVARIGGGTLYGNEKPWELRFATMEGIALDEQELAGVGGGWMRARCRLWIEDEEGVVPPVVELVWTYRMDAPKPLADWTNAIIAYLSTRSDAEVVLGASLEGEGWKLDRTGLRYGAELGSVLPLEQVSGVDLNEGQVKIWAKDRAEPVVAIGRETRNAYVLGTVISSRIHEIAQERAAGEYVSAPEVLHASVGKLGHRIHDVALRLPTMAKLFGWMTFTVFGLISSLMVITEVADRGLTSSRGMLVAALVVSLPSFAWLAILRGSRKRRIQCYEGGIVGQFVGARLSLLWDDLESVTVKMADDLTGAPYVRFEARVGSNSDTIQTRGLLKALPAPNPAQPASPEAARLIDFATKRVLARLMSDYGEHGRAEWTPGIYLEQQAIRVQSRGVVWRRRAVYLPFDQVAGWRKETKRLLIYGVDQPEPVIQVPMKERNAYPGLMLFEAIMGQRAREAQGPQNPPEPPEPPRRLPTDPSLN